MRELIDRQETLNAIDKRFESLLRRFDYDSYENADEKTKLVCDGLSEAEDVVIGMPSAQSKIELLADKEQRIFLAAMEREKKICEKIDEDLGGEECCFLSHICYEIERKVKGALWT